jgi:hypothetical protein
MPWTPGTDPFPADPVKEITDFAYVGELHFVRHAKAPPETSDSLWQLAKPFGATFTVHFEGGGTKAWKITAPRGMYTDLASVPKAVWNIVGPIGKHLEASILHDYLYMAWTDHRQRARRMDWDFADEVLYAGMKASGVTRFDRRLIFGAVHSTLIGWPVFRAKPYTLEQRMNEWLKNLEASHKRKDHGAGV